METWRQACGLILTHTHFNGTRAIRFRPSCEQRHQTLVCAWIFGRSKSRCSVGEDQPWTNIRVFLRDCPQKCCVFSGSLKTTPKNRCSWIGSKKKVSQPYGMRKKQYEKQYYSGRVLCFFLVLRMRISPPPPPPPPVWNDLKHGNL